MSGLHKSRDGSKSTQLSSIAPSSATSSPPFLHYIVSLVSVSMPSYSVLFSASHVPSQNMGVISCLVNTILVSFLAPSPT